MAIDQKAIEKSYSRFATASSALHRLRRARSMTEFAEDWYVFLVAWKGIYSALEQGSKNTPQARQWFGGESARRKNEPMLNFLFHARNDDEHGLDVSVRQQALTLFKVPEDMVPGEEFTVTLTGTNEIHTVGSHGSELKLERVLHFVGLVPVTLRDGQILHPPEQWRGRDVFATDARELAALALIEIGDVIERARGLRKPN